jgi:tRNA (pseudouridine54-N1)-methyltransferase
MRELIYYSAKARTSGNFDTDNLMKAGRMDIVCNVIISAFFISNKMRDDVRLHLIFTGPPNPPMHLEFVSNTEMPISKKDVAGLIKRMLYKVKPGKKTEVFPGCFIEKKGFNELAKDLEKEGKTIYMMDKKGEDIRKLESEKLKDAVFLIGDQEGLPGKEFKRVESRLSVGKPTYFASQTMTIIHNEIDYRIKEEH